MAINDNNDLKNEDSDQVIRYWSDTRKNNSRRYTYWSEYKPSLLTHHSVIATNDDTRN